MSGDGGAEWGGYAAHPDDDTAVAGRQPPAPPKASRRGPWWARGPWRIAMALAGIAAIGVGVVGIVSQSRSASSTTANGVLPLAAFIRAADAVCTRLAPEVDAEYRIALTDDYSGDDLGARRAVAKVQAAARELVREVRALRPPAQDAGQVRQLLAEYTQLVDDAIADTPESNAAADGLQAQIASQAAQFGFHVCGLT